jgi:hypothetical protein
LKKEEEVLNTHVKVEVQLHAFLTSAPYEDEYSNFSLGSF